MSSEAHDFLMGAGGRSASFDGTPPIVHKGEILSYEKRQQRSIKGDLLFWDNHEKEPRWQIVFTLQTDAKDDADDDGVRRIYAKAQMLTAIREAIKKSGHNGNLVGGKLAVKYDSDGEAKERGFNPPKIYKAQFAPPETTREFDETPRDVESFEEDYAYDEEPF